MEQKILGRVFVVGCPRSGTTLLQSILAAHSAVASFPESHLYEKLFSTHWLLDAIGIASHNAHPCLRRFIAELPHPELAKPMPRHGIFVRQFSRAFIDLLDELALSQNKTIWVEKTPGHLRVANRIARLVPDARFVHILRNGPDVVASLYEVSQKYPEAWGAHYRTLDDCIERWIFDTRLSAQYMDNPAHYLVRYEELTREPQAIVSNVCAFLNLLFEPHMLQKYSQTAARVVLEREPWKATTAGAIRNRDNEKFWMVLDRVQQEYVLRRLSEAHLENAVPSNDAHSYLFKNLATAAATR